MPTIVRYPGRVAAGSTSNVLSGFEDWTTTLVEWVDGKTLAQPVLQHRLILNPESRLRRVTQDTVLRGILEEVPVPAGSGDWKAA